MREGSWQETRTKFTYIAGVIFVFGSNLAGRHGLGAAKFARQYYGAKYGIGRGPTGNAYALPTKGHSIQTLSLSVIAIYVKEFLKYAADHSDLKFLLTRVGCGLAGYKDEQMAPLFRGVTSNVQVPEEWKSYL